ncbi:hypothetical protein F5Y19DRAFT_484909 [Xylariaceae sp. FL1651]|nr:hypothetical protein F5Y19DRAFT_484909 [Xylariaceae sp. FL1651]
MQCYTTASACMEAEAIGKIKPLQSNTVALSASQHSLSHIASTRGSSWTWEYISMALSASAIIALVALLARIDDLRLSHWKAPIPLNAIVSILAAISRASLGFAISSCLAQAKWNWFRKRSDSLIAFDRFDEASRGPWGSFWLIIWVRAYHWVAIGAAVTIALLAFEPFVQAIISFKGNIDLANNALEAHLGRTEVLDAGSYFSDGTSGVFSMQLPSNQTVWFEPFKYQPDLGMVSAINNGFYNTSTTSKLTASFICPTANCTWTPFTTLGVCSACNNVTSHLKRYRRNGTNLGTLVAHVAVIETNWTINALPDVQLTNPTDSYGTYNYTAFMAATILTNSQHTISFKNLSVMITTVQVLRAADAYEKEGLRWDDTPVTATECALYFCTNGYGSLVEKGELKEQIIASWSERDPNSYTPVNRSYSVQGFDKWNNYSLYTGAGDRLRTDLELFIPPDDIQRFQLPTNITYRFRVTERAVGSTRMAWPVEGDSASNSPPVVQALYQSTDLPTSFDRVASSLSNWIRDASNQTHTCTTQEWVIRIKVEWPYVTVPLLAIVLGLVFCMLSILETRSLGLDAWKTDMIATLTHSVDAETRAQLRHAHRNGYLDKAAKAMTVTFEDDGYGLELRTKQA